MKVRKREVTIELRSVIDDAGEKELHIVKQKGYYFKRGHLEVLTYIEDVENDGTIDNLITITPKKVNINRSGMFSMNQQFLLGRKSECLYQHPHGNIHMSITTHSIKYSPPVNDNKGELVVDYEAVLNGQVKRDHHLMLTFFEEEEK